MPLLYDKVIMNYSSENYDWLYDLLLSSEDIERDLYLVRLIVREHLHRELCIDVEKVSMIARRRAQLRFRNRLLAKFNHRCMVSGCTLVAALEACHIVPYAATECNALGNGIVLRSDLHRLFDSYMLTILPSGEVLASDEVVSDQSFSWLPSHVSGVTPDMVVYLKEHNSSYHARKD